MNYHITHRTLYDYGEPVTVSHHAARVAPRTTPLQLPAHWSLRISPEPAVRKLRTDYFGNSVCFFSIQELHQRLEIVSECLVELRPGPAPDPARSPAWEEVVSTLRAPPSPEALEAQQFIFDSPHIRISPALADFAAPSFPPRRPLLEAVLDLNHRIHSDFTFDPRATTIATPLEQVLKNRRGVCQDFTHLALGCLRSLGLAARYVSGYLRTHHAPDQPQLVGADATHAWLAVFCPTHGWVDFDPTNDLMPRLEHITAAVGRDFADVSPVSGIITGGGDHLVQVGVHVQPVSPPPDTTPALLTAPSTHRPPPASSP
jgi:transglutaminase-like putative cysteine protease